MRYSRLFYSSICLPRNMAAACASILCCSSAFVFSELETKATAPVTSPDEIMGKTARAGLSIPSTGIRGWTDSSVNAKDFLLSRSSSKAGDILRSEYSFFWTPATATTWPGQTQLRRPPPSFEITSAACAAPSDNSFIGEYFLNITSPSLLV